MRRRFLESLAVPLVLLGCLAFPQQADSAKRPRARNAWFYQVSGKAGWFRKETGKTWIETNRDGVQFLYKETARNAKYVTLFTLFESSRPLWVRLYADHADFRRGTDPTWYRLYKGRWVKVTDLPRPQKRDYRIRLAYFVPSDRKPTPNYAKKIRVVMHFVSEIYRQDFEARNIRSKGLRFQSRNGQPVVHLIRGRRTAAFYNDAPKYDMQHQFKAILPEIPARVGERGTNVIIVFAETYDSGPADREWPGGAWVGNRFSTEGGVALASAWTLRPELCATTVKQQMQLLFDTTPIEGRTAVYSDGRPNSPRFLFIGKAIGAVAHELGHALGAQHDYRHGPLDIMGIGFPKIRWNFTNPPDPERRVRFSEDNARILYTSRYLASDLVLSDRVYPTVSLRWAAPLTVGATTVKVSVTASDNVGLRAIMFFSRDKDPGGGCVLGSRALRGKKQAFEQTLSLRRPLQPGLFHLDAYVADAGGNLKRVMLQKTVGE